MNLHPIKTISYLIHNPARMILFQGRKFRISLGGNLYLLKMQGTH